MRLECSKTAGSSFAVFPVATPGLRADWLRGDIIRARTIYARPSGRA